MATVPRHSGRHKVEYPTSDGKPMAETEVHRDLMIDLIGTLRDHFAGDPLTFVTGNLLLFYEEGNKRKHIAPDVFVAHGVPKLPPRLYYLLWEEPKGPDCVIELTSKTTRSEDRKQKWELYRDRLKVPEYFLFDPFAEYLKPSMQGYRLVEGEYRPIATVEGRLISTELGLQLGREGSQLRLYDPTGRRLPTPGERTNAAEAKADAAEAKADAAEAKADAAEAKADAEAIARRRADAEIEQLRRELATLQHRLSDSK